MPPLKTDREDMRARQAVLQTKVVLLGTKPPILEPHPHSHNGELTGLHSHHKEQKPTSQFLPPLYGRRH